MSNDKFKDNLEKNKQNAEEMHKQRMVHISNLAINLFNSMVDGETVNMKVLINKRIILSSKPTYGLMSIHKSAIFSEMQQTP